MYCARCWRSSISSTFVNIEHFFWLLWLFWFWMFWLFGYSCTLDVFSITLDALIISWYFDCSWCFDYSGCFGCSWCFGFLVVLIRHKLFWLGINQLSATYNIICNIKCVSRIYYLYIINISPSQNYLYNLTLPKI